MSKVSSHTGRPSTKIYWISFFEENMQKHINLVKVQQEDFNVFGVLVETTGAKQMVCSQCALCFDKRFFYLKLPQRHQYILQLLKVCTYSRVPIKREVIRI